VTDENKNVVNIKEEICIERNGKLIFMRNGAFIPADFDTNVSVNFFGFTQDIFPLLETIFNEFMGKLGDNQNAECFLSENIGRLIKEEKITMKVLETNDKWMGFTYPPDKEDVSERIKKMTENGVYPAPLWS